MAVARAYQMGLRAMRIHLLLLLFLIGLPGCVRKPPSNWDGQQVIFAPKAYFDSEANGPREDGEYASVYISGTLTGDGIAYPNNSVMISCYKLTSECLAFSVEALGPNQIGRLEEPTTFKVVRWDRAEVVAKDEAADPIDLCARGTITFDRSAQSVLWVQEPINQTEPKCKSANTKVLKWSVEDPPAWKEVTDNSDRK